MIAMYKNYIIAAVVIAALSLTYYKGYNSGHDNGYNKGKKEGLELGIKQERDRLDIEYNTILSIKLKENSDMLKKQFNLQLEAEKEDKKVEIRYKERVVTVKEIIEKAPNLNNECREKTRLTPEQIKALNEN